MWFRDTRTGRLMLPTVTAGRRARCIGGRCLQAHRAAVGIADERLGHTPVLGSEGLDELRLAIWGKRRRVSHSQDWTDDQVGVVLLPDEGVRSAGGMHPPTRAMVGLESALEPKRRPECRGRP